MAKMTKIKIKTNSSAKKRFSKTGGKNLKIKRAKAFRRHLMTRKSVKANRQSRRSTYFSSADFAGIKLLLPY